MTRVLVRAAVGECTCVCVASWDSAREGSALCVRMVRVTLGSDKLLGVMEQLLPSRAIIRRASGLAGWCRELAVAACLDASSLSHLLSPIGEAWGTV